MAQRQQAKVPTRRHKGTNRRQKNGVRNVRAPAKTASRSHLRSVGSIIRTSKPYDVRKIVRRD